MNTPQDTTPWTAPNAAAVRDSRDRAARNRSLNNSAAMCPMHCGNTAATCKARGRCVYVVTDRTATGR